MFFVVVVPIKNYLLFDLTGSEGISNNSTVPSIAGKDQTYLVEQMFAVVSG